LFLVNPRYLNSGDDDDEDETISNPRRPSPTSQAYSSSNASSVRSIDLDIEINKKSEKNLCIRSNKMDITDKVNFFFLYSFTSVKKIFFLLRFIPNVQIFIDPYVKQNHLNYVVFKHIHVDRKIRNNFSHFRFSIQSIFLFCTKSNLSHFYVRY
jgi:hypothetical protein